MLTNSPFLEEVNELNGHLEIVQNNEAKRVSGGPLTEPHNDCPGKTGFWSLLERRKQQARLVQFEES
jgi:hypothetical protein